MCGFGSRAVAWNCELPLGGFQTRAYVGEHGICGQDQIQIY